tara:strand:+ start:204 stop:368 length:165 start_codon:yes stop_codon:yes gene_type:complete
MNDTNEMHPDIDVMLMDHVDYKEYIRSTRTSMNDFLKAKEEQYNPSVNPDKEIV